MGQAANLGNKTGRATSKILYQKNDNRFYLRSSNSKNQAISTKAWKSKLFHLCHRQLARVKHMETMAMKQRDPSLVGSGGGLSTARQRS